MTLQRSKGFVTLFLIQSVEYFVPIHCLAADLIEPLEDVGVVLWFEQLFSYYSFLSSELPCDCLLLFMCAAWLAGSGILLISVLFALMFQQICTSGFSNWCSLCLLVWKILKLPIGTTGVHFARKFHRPYCVTREQTRVPPLGTIVFKTFFRY